ncbi:MAG: hypothetical protein LCH26_04425 [Proteobacteria bacterium]|nr:hypothetical protein [Pseudomonadota bacterium]
MAQRLTRFFKETGAYSLVELSIALLIIGLIVGGVLKGQELLESARLKSVLAQVNEFRLATGIFMDKFGALPGDFDHASDAIASNLQDGNNNGIIEGPGLAASGAGHEATSYWQHLSAAGLLPLASQAGTGSGAITFGNGAPKAKIGGGFTIAYSPFGDGKHWFLLGAQNGDRGNGALLTPAQAMMLDKQADSGNPQEGHIRAAEGVGGHGRCLTPQGAYNLTNKEKACILYFQM